ncbi:MAG: hypothetical protein AAF518_00765 [Spirochaetota bacterium]
MEKKNNPKRIFHIFDSEIDSVSLQEEIDAKIAKRKIPKAEINKITGLNFQLSKAADSEKFDPSHTAYQFEKAIHLPKFTNPRYWFIRGPIKWVLIKFVSVYATVERKLSENRIKAFYSLIRELTQMKLRHQKLEYELELLKKDYNELKVSLQGGYRFEEEEEWQNRAHAFLDRGDKRILEHIEVTDQVLVLLPEWSNLLNHLSNKKIRFHSIVENKRQFEYLNKFHKETLQYIDSLVDYESYSSFDKIVLGCNASMLPPWFIEKILLKAFHNMASGAKFFLRFYNGTVSQYTPFQPVLSTRIDLHTITTYLKEVGFVNPLIHKSEPGEYDLVTFYKP